MSLRSISRSMNYRNILERCATLHLVLLSWEFQRTICYARSSKKLNLSTIFLASTSAVRESSPIRQCLTVANEGPCVVTRDSKSFPRRRSITQWIDNIHSSSHCNVPIMFMPIMVMRRGSFLYKN